MDSDVLERMLDGGRVCKCGHVKDSHFYGGSLCLVDKCTCDEYDDAEPVKP